MKTFFKIEKQILYIALIIFSVHFLGDITLILMISGQMKWLVFIYQTHILVL